jgi:hypothetical protein
MLLKFLDTEFRENPSDNYRVASCVQREGQKEGIEQIVCNVVKHVKRHSIALRRA